MWFSKKEIPKQNESYDMLVKEYQACLIRLSKAESRLDRLELENETLRDKVLRKIQFKKEEEKAQETMPTTKSLNTFNPFGM